jgi:hypothetical protein
MSDLSVFSMKQEELEIALKKLPLKERIYVKTQV